MPLNFPSSPGIGQTYGFGDRIWTWNGDGWDLTPREIPQGPQGTQGLQGAQGTQGRQGLQGTQGVQGLSNQGVQGTQGAILSPTGGLVGGEPERIFYLSETNIDASYTVPSGYNALSVGPHTIAGGVSITIPAGSTWIVIEPT